MTNSKHTPTPWAFDKYKSVVDERGQDVLVNGFSMVMSYGEDQKVAKANAAHIVKCVNMHDELVEALRPFATEVLDNYDDDSYPDVCTPQAKAYRYAISVLKKAGAL